MNQYVKGKAATNNATYFSVFQCLVGDTALQRLLQVHVGQFGVGADVVRGHDVLENGLAGRSVALLQRLDGGHHHLQIRRMGVRRSRLGRLLGCRFRSGGGGGGSGCFLDNRCRHLLLGCSSSFLGSRSFGRLLRLSALTLRFGFGCSSVVGGGVTALHLHLLGSSLLSCCGYLGVNVRSGVSVGRRRGGGGGSGGFICGNDFGSRWVGRSVLSGGGNIYNGCV